MKSSCRFTPVARPVIGSVEVFEPSSALGSTMSSISWNTLCLSSTDSNTASMTKSTPLKSAASAVGVMRSSSVAGFLLGGLAPLERLGFELLGVALALLRGLDADVLEDDVEAGLGRHVGDTGAHHPRAEHADLLDRGLADALGPRAAAVDGLQVEEERLDHVLGDLAGDQLREVTALDAARGVEVHLRALDGRVQDGPRRRHRRTLELLAQQRRERRQDARPVPVTTGCRRASCSPWHPTAGCGCRGWP